MTLGRARSRAAIEVAITAAALDEPRIIGAILIGSIANGDADEFSDIDYYFYVDGTPWSRDVLARWLHDHALEVNLHYWTGVGKHHLLVGDTRVDISVGTAAQRSDLAWWPHVFFPVDGIFKDEQLVLTRAYALNPQARNQDHPNDVAAYVLNLMNVAIQLCRGEIINARSRLMAVIESRARVMRDLPLGSALWREPTRHAERDLDDDDQSELHRIAFLSSYEELADWVATQLEALSHDRVLLAGAREGAGYHARCLRATIRLKAPQL